MMFRTVEHECGVVIVERGYIESEVTEAVRKIKELKLSKPRATAYEGVCSGSLAD
jgi:hypothetical protein